MRHYDLFRAGGVSLQLRGHKARSGGGDDGASRAGRLNITQHRLLHFNALWRGLLYPLRIGDGVLEPLTQRQCSLSWQMIIHFGHPPACLL